MRIEDLRIGNYEMWYLKKIIPQYDARFNVSIMMINLQSLKT